LFKYLSHHIRNFLSSLGEICRNPLASLLTISVISIALFIPVGLFIIIHNVQNIYASWGESSQITVFLQKDITTQAVAKLQDHIQQNTFIDSIQHLTAKEALDEFANLSGQYNISSYLEHPPFGDILFIKIKPHISQENIQQFVDALKTNQHIDLIDLDSDWLHKFNEMVKFLEHFTEALTIILSLAITLIINQIIKLRLQTKKELILVSKLIGATNSFIRREFLYLGFWYGLISAVFCWLLIKTVIMCIQRPITNLAVLYQATWHISGINISTFISLCCISIILSISGAWLAVSKYLGDNNEYK
jgi:cell division transport system permease protein